MISLIVAIGQNNEMGRNGDLLTHLPSDLKHFKQITSGHSVIMGRKTFDSLPKGPLPNRRNLVISRQKDLLIDGAEVYTSLDEALLKVMNEEEVFIIGGGQIYSQMLPDADRLYLTRIHASFPDADTFFPEIRLNEWRETNRESFPSDEKHPFAYTFIDLERM
ncbi:dihydrofolate reductase [Bacteroidales bacterium OttesenSCG-928-I14]|nr:dihydrofolate reductase [Bacteroidales bacterium OttesenSCG-928-I14]